MADTLSKQLIHSDQQLLGQVGWKSPSNIALIKYWGKRPVQIPMNASISFTLAEALTTTSLAIYDRKKNDPWITFYFEGKEEQQFAERIRKFFKSLTDEMPFLEQYTFLINSSNSFPHSAGIASSASAMSALALCLCEIEKNISTQKYNDSEFFKRASYIARLGSGSAARSLFPGMAVWGKTNHVLDSSDDYAIPYSDVREEFQSFHDDVLIISSEQKSVSSSVGHQLMEDNPFSTTRYKQANENMGQLLSSLQTGDLELFGKIVEEEALTLHALMMCSDPGYILMKPNTLTVIEKIRSFRNSSSLPVFFTLDAGPNVHVLYPDSVKNEIQQFINSELLVHTENNHVIKDFVGSGPEKFL